MFNIVRVTGKKLKAENYFCRSLENFYDAQSLCNYLNSKSGVDTNYKVVNSTYELSHY